MVTVLPLVLNVLRVLGQMEQDLHAQLALMVIPLLLAPKLQPSVLLNVIRRMLVVWPVLTALPVHAQNVLPVIPSLVVLALSALPELMQSKETLHAHLAPMVIPLLMAPKLQPSVLLNVIRRMLDVWLVLTMLPLHAQSALPVIPSVAVPVLSVLPELTQSKETLHAHLAPMVIPLLMAPKLQPSVLLVISFTELIFLFTLTRM
jgi:hypothetical protein